MHARTARAFAKLVVAIGMSVLCLASGCRPSGAPPPEKVDADRPRAQSSGTGDAVELALNWFPEAEHGGYFAALVHGYYEQAGLKVKILPGGPNAPVIQRVAGRQVAFGIENADRVLLARAQEAYVVAVMAPLQKSPRAILVHPASGIERIDELADVTLAVNNGASWVQYLKKRFPLRNVRFVPYTGNVTQFLVNENYAQQAYVFSEPFIVRQKGGTSRSLLVAETGYNPYTSVLITADEIVKSRPNLVRKFVDASVRGWQTYLDRPEETNRYIQGINPEMGMDILAFGVESLRPLCVDGLSDAARELGRMTAPRWKSLADQLVEAGVLRPNAVDSLHAFTTEFLPDRSSKAESASR